MDGYIMEQICEKAYEAGDIETIRTMTMIDKRMREIGKKYIERYEAKRKEEEENYKRREEIRWKYM
jgi:hypothetical protein